MYQQRVSCELLSSLANCLLNDTIYEIVKGLMEIQHVTEKHLEQQRICLTKAHRLELAKMANEVKCNKMRRIKKKEMKLRHKKELIEMDKRIVLHLDEKVMDQQSTLQLAGVPGFYATRNPVEIKVQMHLLDFILRLSRVKP
ncbi:hypothetical protein B566_EDAN008605 [Ephemera danica]|nr:hypothetical protein B566_EDAN008605 [Ephemera danica]